MTKIFSQNVWENKTSGQTNNMMKGRKNRLKRKERHKKCNIQTEDTERQENKILFLNQFNSVASTANNTG
jgi:hypothetical protein